jgi:hypothetical protein
MKTYKQLAGFDGVVRGVLDNNGTSIPFDPQNSDFQEYQRWLAEGNVPLAVDALVPQENGDTFTLSV